MAAISQTTLSNASSWMRMLEFRLRFINIPALFKTMAWCWHIISLHTGWTAFAECITRHTFTIKCSGNPGLLKVMAHTSLLTQLTRLILPASQVHIESPSYGRPIGICRAVNKNRLKGHAFVTKWGTWRLIHVSCKHPNAVPYQIYCLSCSHGYYGSLWNYKTIYMS